MAAAKERWFVIIANNRGDALFPVVDPDEPSLLHNFPSKDAALRFVQRNPLAKVAGANIFRYGDGESF